MATPTLPSPASKRAAVHNVGTPLTLSSPAPRSVPSPATTRKEAGKTPAAASTGSKTVGGTPMIPSLSQQGSLASPMPIGLTPTGLGVDLGTPGLAATPALGAGMVPTMSELGLTASGGLKRNEDEERRAKMRKILKTIGRPKGRVGEEGIARVSRRVGFANDIDAEKLSNEERERRVGNRTISIAGNTVVIDVDLKENIPQAVTVTFQNDLSNQNGQAERASSILLNDLKPAGQPQINTMLDKFHNNLERLAKLDRLSTKVNCFDALSGIYVSLKKLYEQESELAKTLAGRKTPETIVIETKSGRPSLHEDASIGLSLTYHGKNKIWFETERCPSGLFPPMRISSSWLGDEQEGDTMTWQDPPLTYLGMDQDASMADDGSLQTLPDVRFTAKFDPPVILPWQVAATVFQAVESTIPPAFQLPAYLSLLLGEPVNNDFLVTNASIATPSGDVDHLYRISVAKHDAGFRLEELPFSHPRQIVQLLPLLRQWSTFGDILLDQLNAKGHKKQVNGTLELNNLLANGIDASRCLIVECAVVTSPAPMLCLTFPLDADGLCSADLQVLPNGELRLDGELSIANAGKALAIGDLGVWIEWIRLKHDPESSS